MSKDIAELKSTLIGVKSNTDSLRGQIGLLQEQINSLSIKIEEDLYNKELYSKCVELLYIVKDSTKTQIKNQVESLVTYALQSILGEKYGFELVFDRRGNYEEVLFKIITPNLSETYDPKDTESGFVLDLVATSLRLVLLSMFFPKENYPIILDEPFKHISANYVPKISKFLNTISKKMGKQIIMVTHNSELIGENIIKIGE